jgi:hypothetical protein
MVATGDDEARGGVAVSAERIRAVVQDLGLGGLFETSAKEGWQVTELTEAIRDGIDWDALPTIGSSVLFPSRRGSERWAAGQLRDVY